MTTQQEADLAKISSTAEPFLERSKAFFRLYIDNSNFEESFSLFSSLLESSNEAALDMILNHTASLPYGKWGPEKSQHLLNKYFDLIQTFESATYSYQRVVEVICSNPSKPTQEQLEKILGPLADPQGDYVLTVAATTFMNYTRRYPDLQIPEFLFTRWKSRDHWLPSESKFFVEYFQALDVEKYSHFFNHFIYSKDPGMNEAAVKRLSTLLRVPKNTSSMEDWITQLLHFLSDPKSTVSKMEVVSALINLCTIWKKDHPDFAIADKFYWDIQPALRENIYGTNSVLDFFRPEFLHSPETLESLRNVLEESVADAEKNEKMLGDYSLLIPFARRLPTKDRKVLGNHFRKLLQSEERQPSYPFEKKDYYRHYLSALGEAVGTTDQILSEVYLDLHKFQYLSPQDFYVGRDFKPSEVEKLSAFHATTLYPAFQRENFKEFAVSYVRALDSMKDFPPEWDPSKLASLLQHSNETTLNLAWEFVAIASKSTQAKALALLSPSPNVTAKILSINPMVQGGARLLKIYFESTEPGVAAKRSEIYRKIPTWGESAAELFPLIESYIEPHAANVEERARALQSLSSHLPLLDLIRNAADKSERIKWLELFSQSTNQRVPDEIEFLFAGLPGKDSSPEEVALMLNAFEKRSAFLTPEDWKRLKEIIPLIMDTHIHALTDEAMMRLMGDLKKSNSTDPIWTRDVESLDRKLRSGS